MSARSVVIVAGVALICGVGLGVVVGGLSHEREPAVGPATTVTVNPERARMTPGEEAAYDRGFGDGAEYEAWFCVNQVVS